MRLSITQLRAFGRGSRSWECVRRFWRGPCRFRALEVALRSGPGGCRDAGCSRKVLARI